jgi:hypothetical protein
MVQRKEPQKVAQRAVQRGARTADSRAEHWVYSKAALKAAKTVGRWAVRSGLSADC